MNILKSRLAAVSAGALIIGGLSAGEVPLLRA